jgi:hypothetical protein
MNLAGSFSRILGWTIRIHILTSENVPVGPKGLKTRSFTWGYKFLRWAKTSHMLPCKDVSVGPKEVMTRSHTLS